MGIDSLAYELLDLAQHILGPSTGEPSDARHRRAISTAYYAVLHAICQICAGSLVGPRNDALREAIYRTVEHGPARKLLTSATARGIAASLDEIGGNFADLQTARHAADYRPRTAETISRERAEAILVASRQTYLLITS